MPLRLRNWHLQAKKLSAQAKSLEDRVNELANEIGIRNTDSDKPESTYKHANYTHEAYKENTDRLKDNKSRHAEDEDAIIFDVKKKNNGHRKFNREKVHHNRQINDEVIPIGNFKGF